MSNNLKNIQHIRYKVCSDADSHEFGEDASNLFHGAETFLEANSSSPCQEILLILQDTDCWSTRSQQHATLVTNVSQINPVHRSPSPPVSIPFVEGPPVI